MFLGLSGISAPDIYMSGGENLYVVGRNNVVTPSLREGAFLTIICGDMLYVYI